ncbi:liprin-beta-1-like isoform X1 [Maniola hyperantus]|uniref:liprin-beta-1-like isoform X1 n=1 Tax=Aphantopus hyperantus TaxID=2795564 RepID=UPI001567C6F4|nr:liprin-beta-1 isoform X1 [Maniola hyperantus]
MRELGRGGSLVAATIAALHSRSSGDAKSRPFNSRSVTEENRNVLLPLRETEVEDFSSQRFSGASERPASTASEASERDSASVHSSEAPPLRESGDSDSPEEATLKCPNWTDRAAIPTRADSSDCDTSTSDEESEEHEYDTGSHVADYQTLTPSRQLDNSARCDNDFKWMPSGEVMDDPGDPNFLARVEEFSSNASLDRRRRPASDRSDRDRKTRSSMSTKPPQHPSSVRASPRSRHSSRNEETPPDLQRRWNSYEHFRWPEGGWWPPPMCWCHGPPAPPPCCMHERPWPSHPSLPVPPRTYKNDAEDRVRRLEADKESLQLQVQVLSEQIAAQTEKMADLERSLHDTRQRLDDTDQRLQKEMLQRSSLETQKLELLSKLSEVRLRAAERGLVERSPPPEPAPVARPAPPRTPPANYGRQIERNTHMYSSLPRSSVLSSEARVAFGKNNMVVARGRGQSVPNLAEKDEAIPRGSPSPSLREVRSRLGSGGGVRLEGDELSRSSLRASAPRQRPQTMPWQTTDVRQWDCETTCGWLESLGLESYVGLARTWLNASPDARGLLASASHTTIEKELAIKHPLQKKKIVLALSDLLGGHGDPLLTAAGRLDTAWTLRWLEDVGVCGARAAAADAALDGRGLHRLTHTDLHTHLRVAHALHALSIRRGIQVLRDNKYNPETMIRRAPESEVVEVSMEGEQETANTPAAELARWSSHRVMQWLKEIDLAEYAPNLRGAGVHGGLMLLEPRFTAELLAALLNIPANKTLLRRHLTQRFNDLLGRDVIQQKRNAEQTLGYQPLTATTKYKVPKKSQFSLKRKKSKDDLELGELVCPLHDDCSGDLTASPMMKVKSATAGVASAVCPPRDDARTH